MIKSALRKRYDWIISPRKFFHQPFLINTALTIKPALAIDIVASWIGALPVKVLLQKENERQGNYFFAPTYHNRSFQLFFCSQLISTHQ